MPFVKGPFLGTIILILPHLDLIYISTTTDILIFNDISCIVIYFFYI